MLEFQIDVNRRPARSATLYGNTVDAAANQPLAFSNIDNAYNGQVLTFLSGAAKGRSTRIVGFIPPNTFRVMNVQLEDGSLITDPDVTATRPTAAASSSTAAPSAARASASIRGPPPTDRS